MKKYIDINDVYPIGSIYLSVNNINPKTLFGGEWEQIQNRFLLGASDTHPAGSIGGEATHILSVEEMPMHTHTRGTMNITGELNYNETYSGGVFSTSGLQGAFIDGGRYGEDWYVSGRKAGSGWPKIKFDASKTWSGATSAEGNSQPHNNMPPYLAIYIWQRIS